MGRSPLLGKPPRTRTVDDDLADSNLTRQDLANGEYAFKRVWSHLRSLGWYSKRGPALGYDHFYIKPGKTLAADEEDVDYFYGEAKLVAYARGIRLFGEPPSERATTHENGMVHQANGSSGAGVRPSSTTSNGHSTPSPTVKTENGGGEQGDGKNQANGKRRAEVKRRQWPDDHRHKGRHAADAICIDSSDDEEEDENAHTPEPPARRADPVAQRARQSVASDAPARRVNPGKRKAKRVVDEEDEDFVNDDAADHGYDDVRDGSDGTLEESDATAYSEASTETSASGKRPLLTTQRSKKRKLTTKDKNDKAHYKPQAVRAGKVKSGPKGLLFTSGSIRDILEETPPQTAPMAAQQTNSATHASTNAIPANHGARHAPAAQPTTQQSSVAHGFQAQVDATVKEEPPTSTPGNPPPRPPSRASSNASSRSTSSSRPVSASITLLEVEGVVFPSCRATRYRVVLTQTEETGETTLLLEDQLSFEQRRFTFVDITKLSEKPNNLIPEFAIYQALYKSLIELSAKVVVPPPSPPESKSVSTNNDPSSIDFIRDQSAERIELEYPQMATWGLHHRFPMTVIPEGPQTRSLRQELARTRQELQAAREERDAAICDRDAHKLQLEQLERDSQKAAKAIRDQALHSVEEERDAAIRDRDAYKRQLEQLDREYQKGRKTIEDQAHQIEQLKQRQQKVHTTALSQSPSSTQAPPQARAAQTPPKAPQQSKTQPSSQPPAHPQQQRKTPAQPNPKASPQPKQAQASPRPKTKPPQPQQAQASSLPKTKAPPKPQDQRQTNQSQQKSPVRATPKTSTQTSPAQSSASTLQRTSESIVFHAQGNWLDTAFLKCSPGTSWIVKWSKLITMSSTHFAAVSEGVFSKEVKLKASGSYRLTMVVTHASSMLLSIVITTAGTGVRRVSLHPHLVQIAPSAKNQHYKSHFDQILHCSVNDTVFAELQLRAESAPLPCEVERLEKLKSFSNDWRIELTTGHPHTNGTANGKR